MSSNLNPGRETASVLRVGAEPHGIAAFETAYEQLLTHRPGVLASESGGELAWLHAARNRDAARWRREGLPTRRQEDWKYVSLNALLGLAIDLPHQQAALPDRSIFTNLPVENSVEIVTLNGHFVRAWSKLPTARGLKIEALSEILDECVAEGWSADRLQKIAAFKTQVEGADGDRENVFSAMNTSFMPDALFITLERGAVVTDPVVIYHFTGPSQNSEGAGGGQTLPQTEAGGVAAGLPPRVQISAPRIFVNVEGEAELALLEVFSGASAAPQDPGSKLPKYFNTCVSDVKVARGARLSYAKVQLEGAGAYHIGTTRIHQQRDSWVETQQFSFGGSLARHNLHLSLEGEGAEARVDGLYLSEGSQVIDNHTSIEHLVPNTLSQQLYKGILMGQSKAVFNGRIKIHKDAQNSNSAQLNNNLLLSSKAEVDTKPELDILADDVKASHGATIGQMDPEHLFYLQTRAIKKDQAIQLLSRGFALEVVYRIENHELRRQMLALVTREMDLKVSVRS